MIAASRQLAEELREDLSDALDEYLGPKLLAGVVRAGLVEHLVKAVEPKLAKLLDDDFDYTMEDVRARMAVRPLRLRTPIYGD